VQSGCVISEDNIDAVKAHKVGMRQNRPANLMSSVQLKSETQRVRFDQRGFGQRKARGSVRGCVLRIRGQKPRSGLLD